MVLLCRGVHSRNRYSRIQSAPLKRNLSWHGFYDNKHFAVWWENNLADLILLIELIYSPWEDSGQIWDDPLGRVGSQDGDRMVAVEAKVDKGPCGHLDVVQVLLVCPCLPLSVAFGAEGWGLKSRKRERIEKKTRVKQCCSIIIRDSPLLPKHFFGWGLIRTKRVLIPFLNFDKTPTKLVSLSTRTTNNCY